MKKSVSPLTEIKHCLTSEQLLIVDKNGIMGRELLLKLKPSFESTESDNEFISRIVLAGPQEPPFTHKNIFFIPYYKDKKRLPLIPENNYSHIFVFYNGEKEILDTLPEFIRKSESLNAKLFIIMPVFIAGESLALHLVNSYKHCFVIITGEIFAVDYFPDFSNTINNFINHVIKGGRIVVPGNGLGKTYPVFLEDAVTGILKVAFGLESAFKTFFLFPKHPLTELSLAHVFQKANPLIRVDFIKRDAAEQSGGIDKLLNSVKGEYLFQNNDSLKNGIKQIVDLVPKKSPELLSLRKNVKKKTPPKKKFLRFSPLMLLSFFVFLVLILPVILMVAFSFMGMTQLKSAKSAIERGDFISSKKAANSSKTLFEISGVMAKAVSMEASSVGKKDLIESIAAKILMGKEGASAVYYISESAEGFAKIVTSKESSSREDFVNASNSLKNAIAIFQKLKTESISIPPAFDSSVDFITGIIDVMPNLFGFDKTKTYLVLFQNNMELRPGGGFIGSYAILNVHNGKIKNFAIHDVYEADGQLKGHIEPPFAIRRYLPQVHAYLRDSNFDVDFRKNASMAAFFLDHEMGEAVDGVIAVDVSFVKGLLKELGPVFVSDYNETVTGDNLYILTQAHAEKNFFPGSSQKKDFLRSLFNALQANLITKKDLPYLKIMEVVVGEINKKHLLFAVSDAQIQNLFTVSGMSSSLWDSRENSANSINDFLGVNEANIGVNKANYFVKRKINQETVVDKVGRVTGRLTLTYENKSTGWPGGDYRNYIRLILPFGTQLDSVAIDGKEQKLITAITDPVIYESKKFKPPVGLEIEKTTEEGKALYGFLVNIPAQFSKKVIVTYILPQKIDINTPAFDYSLKVFKQPGTEEYPLSFKLTYPDGFKVYDKSRNFLSSPNAVSFSEELFGDIKFNIGFSRK